MSLFFLNNTFSQILNFKYFLKLLIYFFSFFVGLILFFLIKIISPFILVRFFNIKSTRLGHFMEDIDIYLSRKKKRLNNSDLPIFRNSLDIFYFRSITCNNYLKNFYKKKFIIFPTPIMYWVDKINIFFVRNFNLKNYHENGSFDADNLNHPPLLNRDIYGLYNTTEEPNFFFKKNEINEGKNILKKLGISSKYVCIYTRDSRYLNEMYSYNDWSKHDYRNIDIDNLIETTKMLINKGFQVVRVGRLTEKKMSFQDEHFVDYSHSQFQSDFMDLFLIANCEFFISSSSGIDAIATSFRKDIVFPFLFPVMDTKSSTHRHFLAYRNIYSIKLKRNLNFSEIIKNNYGYIYDNNQIIRNNLKIIDIDPIEIKLIVEDYLNTKNNYNYNNLYNQKFYKIFKKGNFIDNGSIFHTPENIKFRVSEYFLKHNQEWTL